MNTTKVFVTLLIIFTNFYRCYAETYKGWSLYNIYPTTQAQIDILNDEYTREYNATEPYIKFVEFPPQRKIVQVLVLRGASSFFEDNMKKNNIQIKRLLWAANEAFEEQLGKDKPLRSGDSDKTWDQFQTLDEVYNWLNKTNNKYMYTDLKSIGVTAGGRDIPIFTIEVPPMPNYQNLKVVFEGAIHGSEWQSTSAITYLIHRVLTDKKGIFSELKKKYFLHFLPVLNPDGYVYSQSKDRIWRKNRRRFNNSIGVNLNRNFDYNFGKYDSSDDPTSQKYQGPYPFSEPETRALRDYMHKIRRHVTFYFSLHGHGQTFLLPYSDSERHVVNYHEVKGFANKAVFRINTISRRVYDVGNAHEVLGVKYSGDSASWVKKTFHIPYTVTIQLRDNGEMGIALPAKEIKPAAKEMAEGLTTFILTTGRYQSFGDGSAAIEINMLLILLSVLILIF